MNQLLQQAWLIVQELTHQQQQQHKEEMRDSLLRGQQERRKRVWFTEKGCVSLGQSLGQRRG